MEKQNKIWGFLRETKEAAVKDGIDPDYNIPRTGLEEYLEVISLMFMTGYITKE